MKYTWQNIHTTSYNYQQANHGKSMTEIVVPNQAGGAVKDDVAPLPCLSRDPSEKTHMGAAT